VTIATAYFAFDENSIRVISHSMKRELLILRHAKSDWDTGAASDFDRPLSKRGRKDAPRVGRYLSEQGLVPDYIVSSPAERAKQTVIAVCRQMDIREEQINWDSRIYHAGAGSLLDVLNDSPGDAQRVLIAGHNPGLEILLQNLCNHEIPMPDDYKLLPTAAVAHLEILSEWKNLEGGLARLVSLTRSRSLSE
jgi:phosphohistidine phosphatase